LAQTATLWPPVQRDFGLVHQAAAILGNPKELSAQAIRRQFQAHLRVVRRQYSQAGAARPTLRHFLKVTASYRPGLFHCYEVADLPRTNNALEQLFGSTRHHERRCTGRKAASPGLVLRGAVRLVAGVGSRLRTYSAQELTPVSLPLWRKLRAGLEHRRQARTLRRRFRKNSGIYLRQLEAILLRPTLPP